MDFEEIGRLLVGYSAVVRYWKGAALHMLMECINSKNVTILNKMKLQ